MERHAELIDVRPEKREEYLRLHAAVWPEIEDLIRACNIRNYSIFLHGDRLFAYYEYVGEDFEADMRKMEENPKNREWWELCKPCQQPLADCEPGEWWKPAAEVWHLD